MRELSAAEQEYVESHIQNSSDDEVLCDLQCVEIFKAHEVYYNLWKPLLDKEAQKRGLSL